MFLKKAFTLIELLVVIAIVGILTGFLIYTFNGATNAANDARRKVDIANLYRSIIGKGVIEGNYPQMGAEIERDFTPSELQEYIDTYLASTPYDPTGDDSYFYYSNGTDFAVGAVLSDGGCFVKSTNSDLFSTDDCSKVKTGGIGLVSDFMILAGGASYTIAWSVPSSYSVSSPYVSTALVCLTKDSSDTSTPSDSELFTNGTLVAIINGTSSYYYTASNADYNYFCKAIVYDNTVVTNPGTIGSAPNTSSGGFIVTESSSSTTSSNYSSASPTSTYTVSTGIVPSISGSVVSGGETSPNFTVSSETNAVAGTGSITLSWVPGSGSTHTIIRRAESSTVDPTIAPETLSEGVEVYNQRNDADGQVATAQHTYTDTGLNTEKYYCYSAWAYNSDTGNYSNGYVLACSGIAPSDPSGLSLFNQVDRFDLSWTKGSGTNTVIRRQANTAPTSQDQGLQVYNSTDSSFTDSDSNLTQGVTYCYSVWSYKPTMQILSRSYVSGCGKLNPVGNTSNLTFSNAAYNSITLTWSKAVNSTKSVVVRKQGSVPTSRTDGTTVYNGDASTFMDTGLTRGVNYCYAIWGTDESNYSITSSTGCEETLALADNVSFNSSGSSTWTVPSDVVSINVVVIGGGGGGGAGGAGGKGGTSYPSNNANGGGGGGGGSGYVTTQTMSVTPGETLNIVTGGGGTGGASYGGTGGIGGTSSITSSLQTVSAAGGNGGGGGASSACCSCSSSGGSAGTGRVNGTAGSTGTGGGGSGGEAGTGGSGYTYNSTTYGAGGNGGSGIAGAICSCSVCCCCGCASITVNGSAGSAGTVVITY